MNTATTAPNRVGIDLPAPASTNPDADVFTEASTLKELEEWYENHTSPEAVTWDGERPQHEVTAAYAAFNKAYAVRRDELDPAREYAYCLVCDTYAGCNPKNGRPTEHTNPRSGRTCWMS